MSSRHMSGPRVTALVVCLSVLAALCSSFVPVLVRAHGDGQELDAGFAHIVASADADGTTTVEVRITETDDCGKFWTGWLSAQRTTTSVDGEFEQREPCAFAGSIVLPEQGRWTVTARLVYATRPTEIQIPVGFAGESGTFERTDWLHVALPPAANGAGSVWYRPSGTLTYAVIGLLIGTGFELARRRLAARRVA